MASRPYPETPVTGEGIHGLGAASTPGSTGGDARETAKVFHAATALDAQGNIVTTGGRVLCATAVGETVEQAQRNAYAAVAAIHWEHEFHRHDIGWRAIARESR